MHHYLVGQETNDVTFHGSHLSVCLYDVIVEGEVEDEVVAIFLYSLSFTLCPTHERLQIDLHSLTFDQLVHLSGTLHPPTTTYNNNGLQANHSLSNK